VLSISGNSFKTVGKAFQVTLIERMPRVCNTGIKAKGGYFEESQILSMYALLVLKSGAGEQRVVIRRTLYSAEANRSKQTTQQCPKKLQPKPKVQSATKSSISKKCFTIKHTPG
jgi:hypothetical protein